jgi:sugar phosphate isomerase/epimerase
MDTAKIAVQLYTLREYAEKDMSSTLQRVAEMGYRSVELAGYGDLNPGQVQERLSELGIKAPTSHVALWFFENQLEQTLEELQSLGCKYAVVPWLPEEWRTDKERVGEFAAFLNHIGEICQAAGIQLAYHNHAFEFEKLADSTIWQELINLTDPTLVKFEFDVYWGAYAGVDPAEIIASYAGRIALLHMKDMLGSGEARHDVPVGAGLINWTKVLKAAQQANVDWFIVELDHPQEAFTDVATGLQNLKSLMERV